MSRYKRCPIRHNRQWKRCARFWRRTQAPNHYAYIDEYRTHVYLPPVGWKQFLLGRVVWKNPVRFSRYVQRWWSRTALLQLVRHDATLLARD